MSSSRLPGKVLLPLNGTPSIVRQINRIRKSKYISEIVVATSNHSSDDSLVDCLRAQDIEFVRGSLTNVYERFLKVLDMYPTDQFVRLTADCPLFMPEICDDMIATIHGSETDYLSNSLSQTFPDGCDIEIVRTDSFLRIKEMDLTKEEKEHVTVGLYHRPWLFKCADFKNSYGVGHGAWRWTLDTQVDYEFIQSVYGASLGSEADFNYTDVVRLIEQGKTAIVPLRSDV